MGIIPELLMGFMGLGPGAALGGADRTRTSPELVGAAVMGFMGLGPGAALTTGTRPVNSPKPEQGYPPVPSLVDPGVWPAGSAASRRAGQSSGQPLGLKWQTAQNFMTSMPMMVGR